MRRILWLFKCACQKSKSSESIANVGEGPRGCKYGVYISRGGVLLLLLLLLLLLKSLFFKRPLCTDPNVFSSATQSEDWNSVIGRRSSIFHYFSCTITFTRNLVKLVILCVDIKFHFKIYLLFRYSNLTIQFKKNWSNSTPNLPSLICSCTAKYWMFRRRTRCRLRWAVDCNEIALM